MKNLLLPLFLAGVLLSAGRAAAGPRIVCDAPVYDFGTVTDKQDVAHTYTLRNTGDSDLRISRVHTSCGCTTANLKTRTLSPGDSVGLEVRFNLKGRHGAQTKKIYITSNDPVTPTYSLTLKGDVRYRYDLQPAQLYFAVSEHAPPEARAVEIWFNTKTPVRITGLETNHVPFAEVTLKPLQEGKHYRLVVRMKPDYPLKIGMTTGFVGIETDAPDKPNLEVPVMVQKRPEIMVVPSRIHLSATFGKPARTRRYLLVRSDRARPVTVMSVEPPDPTIRTDIRQLSPGTWRIELDDILPARTLQGKPVKLLVKTATGTIKTLEVPIQVTWRNR